MFASLLNDTYNDVKDFFDEIEGFLESPITNLIAVILLLYMLKRFGTMIINRAIRKAVRTENPDNHHAEKQREETIISIVDVAFKVAMWVFGIMLILAQIGVDVAPLIAGASIAGVAIGFGAQSLVKDFVSGLFIIMENQYRVGDVIRIAGVSGSVEKITIRETVLRNLDGHQHHIPNGIIDVATNMTMDFARININIGVGYDTKIAHAQEVINQVGQDLASDPNWSDKIIEAPTFSRVKSFGPSEVLIKVLGKVKPGKQWAVGGEFNRRIKKAFDENDIVIPYPQSVIHQAKDLTKAKKSSKK